MGRNKKYTTDDERKAANRERVRKWMEANKDAKAELNKQYYEANKAAILEQRKQYNEANKNAIADYKKQYYEANRAAMLERQKQYSKTPIGRANNLISNYRQADKRHNRGECTLTTKWIVDNIFSKSCIYCGESDWHKLGCDRINNDLPHTPDNVVCSCWECNDKRGTKKFEEFLKKD